MTEVAVVDRSTAEKLSPTKHPQHPEQAPQKPAAVQKLLKLLVHRDRKNPDATIESIAEGVDAGSPTPTRGRHWYRTAHPPREGQASTTEATASELTAKELRALGFKFDEYKKQNPPIEGIFDPEKADSNAPEYVRQQEALATSRTLIEAYIEQDSIEDDASVSRAKLRDLVDKFGVNYGFTDPQKQITKELVDEYYDHRQKGIDLRAQYTDDRELVRKITGLKIPDDAKFDISVGPWGLEITMDNPTTQYFAYRGEIPPTDFLAGGAADVSAIPPYIILNGQNPDKNAVLHERQHVRYALSKRVLGRNNQDVYHDRIYTKQDSTTTHREHVKASYRLQRNVALDSAKDEIFAFSYNSNRFPIELFSGQDGNPYDYLQSQREFGAQHANPMYGELSQNILVDEYIAMLSSAAANFDTLVKIGGYSKERAIALLTDKPVAEWSEVTQMLLAAKRKTAVAQQDTSYTPTPLGNLEPSQSETAGEKAKVIDVVIRPNWYKERALAKIDKQQDETEITDSLALTVISQSLYERTRGDADPYIRELNENGLNEYFALLDSKAIGITNTSQDARVSNQALEEAASNILSQLKERVNKLKAASV